MVILWELWINYTQERYGEGRTSIARIIFKVTKAMAECISRRWQKWNPFPVNWVAILKRVDNFIVQRITERDSWCKPPGGWVKINVATSKRRRSCVFLVRQAEGRVCLAGVYTSGVVNTIKRQMVNDVLRWCELKGLDKIIVESDEEDVLRMDLRVAGGVVQMSKCGEKVNCFAACLANRAEGENIIWKAGGLPKGFQYLMALEGYPHFAFLPGHDIS